MDTNRTTIALDAMGGDTGADVVVPAALQALADDPQLALILVGDQDTLREVLARHNGSAGERLRIHHASQVVSMDDLPSHALRSKKDSSMRVAINLVKEGAAQACVSAGNTGALMATARFVLKMLPGVNRPAICTTLPTLRGHVHVLDLGANVDSSAEHLFEFSVMGSELAAAIDGNPAPTIGLLNIGEEEIKGNEQVKQAAQLLQNSKLNYIGYVEGDGIYAGDADVVVCDGFVGNVMLKTSEGVVKMVVAFMREAFQRNLFTKLSALVVLPVMRALKKRIDPREYNGASLLGLRGIVVKSHGSADAKAFATAIREAVQEVKQNVPQRIRNKLETVLVEERVG